MLHGLGAVPTCAPHYDTTPGRNGHVSDPNDLMYWNAGVQPKQIDIGGDDYLGPSTSPSSASTSTPTRSWPAP